MGPGQDPMATSFTARRPNASHLPAFELPPPPLSGLHQKYHHGGYSHVSQHSPATTLTSVGNLLTPPSNGPEGLSPPTTVPAPPQHNAIPPFTPSSMWATSNGSNPYTFQPSGNSSQYSQGRGIFSPSLNSIVRGSNSPTASETLPPPPYDIHPYPTPSMSMPHTSQAAHQQMMSTSVPVSSVTQVSPVQAQDSFARPPPTPTSSYYSQQSSGSQQASFPYSTGPSPIVQSPISAGGPLGKMSPVNGQGAVPPHHHNQSQPPQQYGGQQHRPYNSYSMSAPVISNVHNPAMVGGGVPAGMIPHFNSGHAAQMHHLYGHQQPSAQNDRPFRCDQCPQSFNRNHDLKRHKRIHLAVKPFPCGHCDKSFSRKDALKRHILVKGCGKTTAHTEAKEIDGSESPSGKSESRSPVVHST